MTSLLVANRGMMTNWLWSLTIFTAIAIGVDGRYQSEARKSFLNASQGVDETFLNFCFHYDGTVSTIKDDAKNGHRCEAKVHMKYTDPILSRDLCRRTFPFHIAHFITDGKVTKCYFDVYVKCDDGWVQIDHKCFQLQTFKSNADNAIIHCETKTDRIKEENPGLAQITKSVYSRFWEVTMNIWDSWMYVPTFEQYELEKTADNTKGVAVLVMGAQNKYRGVGYERFATPPPTTMAEFMCQYIPIRTNAYYIHIMEMYADIYPNFLLGPKGMFMTSSRYGLIQTQENPRRWSVKHYHDACKRVAKVFGGDKSTGALLPTKALYDGEVLKGKQLVVPIVRDDSCYGREFYGLTYTNERIGMYRDRFKQRDNYMCNANSVIHTADGIVASPMGYQSYIGCSLVQQTINFNDCPSDWFRYPRKNGVVFCHLAINEHRNWHRAQQLCQAKLTQLSGFEDQEEKMAVLKHFKKDDGTFEKFWIGAQTNYYRTIEILYGVAPSNSYTKENIKLLEIGRNKYCMSTREHIKCIDNNEQVYADVDILCGKLASRTLSVD